MPLTPRYLLAAYTPDGDLRGYYTSRNTLTDIPAKALWAVSEKSAEEELARLGLETSLKGKGGWGDYIWIVEKVAPQDMGDYTDQTPDRLVKGAAPTTTSGKPVKAQVVDSSDRASVSSLPHASKQTNTEETSEMAMKKKPSPSPAVVAKLAEIKNKAKTTTKDAKELKQAVAVGKPKKATKLAPPPAVTKPTAVKSSELTKQARAAKKAKLTAKPTKITKAKSAPRDPNKRTATFRPKNNFCLCGCGKKISDNFSRGHVFAFNRHLAAIADGSEKKTKVFSPEQVKAMGPWLKTKAGGEKPTVSDPAKIRAKMMA